ncbi:phosphatases II [Hesseltinella vesiculosa]|uniref:protein-tyrosine-phosphatase n=1 Tax=Hesseltinella vesiculosa TaxID=101127 RepID=A0A1X2GXE9_9FUNG|nr:phosphatases II [Hesseltinella vesiculosa]
MITVIDAPGNKQRFLILDAPTHDTLKNYIEPLKRENVRHLVRVCQRHLDYDVHELERLTGVEVTDTIKFDDGTVPSPEDIHQWLQLSEDAQQHGQTIAVHCVSGIGRAPVLVTLSLIEGGMDNLDAISYVRKHRRGALNKKQVRFIDEYKPIHARKASAFTKFKRWF